MNAYEKIIQITDSMTEELVKIRRDFHKYAESGWFEMRTSSIIARKLTEMGVDEVLVGEQVCKREERMGVPLDEALEQNYQRAVEQGGVSVDDVKVTDINAKVEPAAFEKGHVVLKRGKKAFHKVTLA